MNKEYVENLINDLKAIEFGKDYIINGDELCELKKYLIDIHSKLDQLTNNWRLLEEFIKDMLFTTPHENQMLDFILDKMKELNNKKGGDHNE